MGLSAAGIQYHPRGICHRAKILKPDLIRIEGLETENHTRTGYAVSLMAFQGRVAQRITRLTTDQKIPGSNPGTLVMLFLVKSQTLRIVLFVPRTGGEWM